ncbi:hypothetical protein T265_10869 [Opisthorchis viverrini]|uniref:MD-2-related lipid-recognition domain-containing protein n=1 Tax=Opisthorchis viverrini TaxID=6198 RepID=A0A074Z518_OPIVI|nr:hypothetical protein T265_10869 [Opisthorchis viverrini]KER20632.1 hypothetical protein T265_10869 [Opisthorchis viverrini]
MPVSFILICGAVFCVPCLAYSVSYTDCGSTGIFVVSVDIEPCNREPCKLIKGTSVIRAGGANIQGLYPAGPVRIPLQRNGICAQLVPTCPIEAGGVYTYQVARTMPNNVPDVSHNLKLGALASACFGPMTIRWELLIDSGLPFLCIELSVEIAVAAE